MSEEELSGLDAVFERLRVAFGGVTMPRRRTIVLDGDAIDSVEDDEVNERTVVTCPTIIDGVGQLTLDGDFAFTLTPSQARNAIIKRTGAVLVDRALIFPKPSSYKAAYKRIIRVTTTDVGNQIVGVGSGATLSIPPGCCLEVVFTPDGAFPANTGSTAFVRTIDPHWLFDVDFTLLDLGAHTSRDFTQQTAAQGTNRGLTIACSTATTVQTSASTVDTGVPVDGAGIGSPDGRKIGLVIEPSRVNGLATSARTLNYFETTPGDANELHYPQPTVSITLNSAAGPDGSARATSIAVAAGIFNNYSATLFAQERGSYGPTKVISAFNSIPLTLSAWVKASLRVRLVWASRAPWDQNAPPYPVVDTTPVGSGVWQRISVTRPANNFYQFATIQDGTDLSSIGSSAGQVGTSGLFDLAQIEVDSWPSEVILTSDGISGGRRVSYAYGSDLSLSGRLRLRYIFYPKHASTENVSYSTSIGSNASITGMTFFSWSGASRVYAEIIHNNGISGDTGKVHFRDLEGNDVKSTDKIGGWNRDDKLEVFFEIGGGLPTTAKYRINSTHDSDPWTSLTFGTGTALHTVATAGTVAIGWDGVGDTNTPAMRLARVTAFDATGVP